MAMTPVRQSIGGLGNMMFKQAYIIGKALDREIPDIYLQSTKYWEEHQYAIRDFFRNGMGPTIDKVAIHIRRGDYLKAEHFHVNLSTTSYYETAIKMFPGAEFLVFCKDNQVEQQDLEDREFAVGYMERLGVKNFSLAPLENSETDDLNMMSECRDLIMANSSFSWWAAFLGDHARVVCPKEWFVDGLHRTELLDSWIKI